jgi:hypothetical protein
VPDTVSGYPILRYARVPARKGEIPDLAVMLGRDSGRREERGYAVWDATVRGGEWNLYEGRYGMSLADAEDYYAQRMRERGAVSDETP